MRPVHELFRDAGAQKGSLKDMLSEAGRNGGVFQITLQDIVPRRAACLDTHSLGPSPAFCSALDGAPVPSKREFTPRDATYRPR